MYEVIPRVPKSPTPIVAPPIVLPLLNGLQSRGITHETCEVYRCYATPLTPTKQECVYQYTDGYKFRVGGWGNGEQKKCYWSSDSKRTLFGSHLWGVDDYAGKTVYLCEGETDTMALYQLTNGAICLGLGGKPSEELWGEWLAALSVCEHLVLCFDNDVDGDSYLTYVDTHYRGKRSQLVIPPQYKDVAEWCKATDYTCEIELTALPKIPSYIQTGTAVGARLRSGESLYQQGLPLGFNRLDELTRGWYPTAFVVIAAPTKAGKSSFANHLVVNYIQQHRLKVMFVTLEMTVEQTQMLLGACASGVDLTDSSNSEAVLDSIDTLTPYLYWISRTGESITVEILHEWFAYASMLGVTLLVIDPIQAGTTSSAVDGAGATVALDRILYCIQDLTIKYGIAVLMVSHCNETDAEQRVTPNSPRGSRAIGQVATVVLGVQRLDDGISKVYTVVPDRWVGKVGDVDMEFTNRRYTEITSSKKKKSKL